jgi:hypothetical protein
LSQPLLATVDEGAPVRFPPSDVSKEIKSFKFGKACGFSSMQNECHKHLPRRPLVRLTLLVNHNLRLCHFSAPWKETKIITLLKPGKDLHLPQNLRPTSLLYTTGNIFEKLILRIIQRDTWERNLLMQISLAFEHITTLYLNA